MAKTAMVQVKLIGSAANRIESHKACVRGLGLKRIGHVVEVLDTPENRGMIKKVSYLLKVGE
jgi:large subunit ribosomal protein L30